MAPRRGGGGGYYSSSSISCSSTAFSDEQSRVNIAFAALWFVVAVVLFFVATKRFGLSKKQGSPVVGSVFLSFSIFFAFGAQLIYIIVTTLAECGTGGYYSYVAIIIFDWIDNASVFILTAFILTTVCRKLQSEFSRVQPAILTLQAVWAALLGVLLVAVLSISTAMYHYSYSDDSDYSKIYDLKIPLRGVQTTYYALAVAGLLVASASMLKALFSAPAYLRKGTISKWVPVLALSALGYSAAFLGTYIQSAYFFSRISSTASEKSYIHGQQAGGFLARFFYFVAFYAVLQVASYRSQAGAANARPTSMNPTAVPPPQGQPTYNLNHGYDSRLSYGANGYQQSQSTQYGGYQPNQQYNDTHPVRY
ncbi:hypothetical protein ASPVEDRAFT_23747 [Aspergillus versicolor CBS 583.65]|uniref:Uncharacterized protein n=1 Tax=Aspergillus versicolor CBS 583.65 TaxID=1036611 RepID=A0A1L9P5E8_ASPVE|nr:uncharacterized protein ASPVEDRAFT_23747 [Aspergillus versicolor CBS 583.65]OJI96755.1 hypothetical protein ASPVEDRAFT_23747 [Aspergillus versicolor CBS 583.65]